MISVSVLNLDKKRGRRVWVPIASVLIGGLATACDLITGPDGVPISIEYSVDALEVFEEDPGWASGFITYLRASVSAVNVTDDSVTVSMPDCLSLEASSIGGAPTPVWRLVDRQTWPGSVWTACSFGVQAVLAPGDTFRIPASVIPLAEILADSLPTGTYRFQVRVPEGPLVELGEVALPESRYPLPISVYPRDGFYYRVSILPATAPGQAAKVSLEVTHTARFAGTLTRELSLTCPVRLLAFRSAAERETIPVPEAVWAWPRPAECSDETMPVRLDQGSVLTLEADVPSSPIGAGNAQIGDFFLMAIIDVDGRPIRLAVNP